MGLWFNELFLYVKNISILYIGSESRGLIVKTKFYSLLIVFLLLIEISTIAIHSTQFQSLQENQSSVPTFRESSYKKDKISFTTPHTFTANHGQVDNDHVQFYAPGGGLWFTNDGVWIEVKEKISVNSQKSTVNSLESGLMTDDWQPATYKYKRVIIKQEFVGANDVKPIGRHRLSWNSNFFYGNDSTKWYSGVPNYREIYYKNIYNGIDLKYYTHDYGLKYDFIVHPGANVNQIRLKYVGASGLEINNFGNLIIETNIRNLIDSEPYIYQNNNDVQHEVRGEFVKYDDLEFGFKILEEFNIQKKLIIDPLVTLKYSTFVGGTNFDYGSDIELDPNNDAVVTGYVNSDDFPTTNGSFQETFNTFWDVFVFKLNQDGSNLSFSTFVGGSLFEYGYDIALDKDSNIYVTGVTMSTDFPTTSGAYNENYNGGMYDSYIFKLNSNGSNLLYCSYIGGDKFDRSYGIVVNSDGNATITGMTDSDIFPTTPGAYDREYNTSGDSYILQINQTGEKLVYSTFIGGNSLEYAYGIAIDQIGDVYITGYTYSNNFPTTPDAFDRIHNNLMDVFVLKINYNGSKLKYSTYVGGGKSEIGMDITIDSMGNAYVTGNTQSNNFPTTLGAYDRAFNGWYDAFVFKLNHNASKLLFSTYLGGSDYDDGEGVSVDFAGNVYVTGNTSSLDFPISTDAFDSNYSSKECFFTKFIPNGSNIITSSYLGGESEEEARGIAVDLVNNIYITGLTVSPDFPNTTNAYCRNLSGYSDVFVTKLSFSPEINITSLSVIADNLTTNKIYTRYRPYTFRINITDTVSESDLGIVRLNLDPLGTNIQLLWDSTTEEFTKILDPNNYITLNPSSKAINYYFYWTIDFNITFNWTYPLEVLDNIQVYATSLTLAPAWFNTTKPIFIENDLVFNGTLILKGENNRAIFNNSLIRGGEKLNWTGLVVVYENTTNVHPPKDEYDISIWDENDDVWFDSPGPSEPFDIETITPSQTDTNGFNYTINITGIPKECDASNETFMIRIDGDNVTFSDPIPNNITWQTKKDIQVSIKITDIGGGEVNGSTVMHKTSKNNGTTWSDWKLVSGLDSLESITALDVISLNEGRNNLIKWRAADSVGNGPIESESYRILIDTEDVIFSNAWPLSSDVSPTENVDFGITISDVNSGVDVSTIEFAISKDMGVTWGEWQQVDGLKNSTKVNIRVNRTFPNGTDNMVKWRALDIAGNGPLESPPFIINVNTWLSPIKPKVILLSPPHTMSVNETTLELIWELEDTSIEGVVYDLFFDNVNPPNLFYENITNTNFIVDNLTDGETYYWRVIPKVNSVKGICSSGIWWFKVDLAKKIETYKINLTGPEAISLNQWENKSIILTITNLGNVEDIIKLDLQLGNLSKYIVLNNYSMLNLPSKGFDTRTLNIILFETVEPGLYEIFITAISVNSGEQEKVTHKITIEIKGNGNGPDGKRDVDKESKDWLRNMYLILIIVIIIIILLIIAFIMIKRKKRVDQELLTSGAVTIKPGAPVEISIGNGAAAPTVSAQPSTQALPTIGAIQQQTATPSTSTTISSEAGAQVSAAGQIQKTLYLPQLPPATTQLGETKTDESTSIQEDASQPPESAPPTSQTETSQETVPKISQAGPTTPQPMIKTEIPKSEIPQPEDDTSIPIVHLSDDQTPITLPQEKPEPSEDKILQISSDQIEQTPTPKVAPQEEMPMDEKKQTVTKTFMDSGDEVITNSQIRSEQSTEEQDKTQDSRKKGNDGL